MEFVDKSFNLTDKNYRLSIQISLNGFSFCVYDTLKQKHVFIKSCNYPRNITDYNVWTSEISTIIKEIPVQPQTLSCLFLTNKNVFIPKNVFVESKLRSYFALSFHLEELDEIHYKYIPEIDGYCVFAIPSPIVSEIGRSFEKTQYYSQAYKSIKESVAKQQDNIMRIVFCHNFMDISVFKDKKFIINNSYEIYDLKDIIYYISALRNKLELTDVPIYVSGQMPNTEIKKELSNYFPNVFQEQVKRIALMFGNETASQHYNLLSLHECE